MTKIKLNIVNPKSDDIFEILGVDKDKLTDKMELIHEIPVRERINKEESETTNMIRGCLAPCETLEEFTVMVIQLGMHMKEREDQKRIRI